MTISDQNHAVYSRSDVDKLKEKLYPKKNISNIPPSFFVERTQQAVQFTGLTEGTVLKLAEKWGGVKKVLFVQDSVSVVITTDDDRSSPPKKNKRKNKVRRRRRRKTSFAPFDIKTLLLKEEDINDIKIVTRRINAYIRAYIKYYWPPKEVGVFRVSPGHAMIRSLEKETEGLHGSAMRRALTKRSKNVNDLNAHLLAAVIKKSLRELSTPAIPAVLYKQFIDVADTDKDKQKEAVKELIAKMSPEHRKLIARIMVFLRKMIDHKDTTNMNAYNLAVVIAPNILVAPEEYSLMQQLQDSEPANEVITLMIVQANRLFH
jgi:RhoGAP domain